MVFFIGRSFVPNIESNFTLLDWLIVAVYLLGTVAIGIFVNRFIHKVSDFLVVGRLIKTRLGVATMIGSELGLVTAMFAAQKGFTGGFAAFHIGILALLACLVVGFTGMIVVRLRELKVMTIPEYYEKRFRSRGLRVYGGAILALAGILNMGLFLKAGATFVMGLTGMNDPAVINIVMTVMILLVLFYTILGGMMSVVITDYIQFVVLTFGLIVAVAMSISRKIAPAAPPCANQSVSVSTANVPKPPTVAAVPTPSVRPAFTVDGRPLSSPTNVDTTPRKLQVGLQPSPFAVLLSSQSSPGSIIPSPQNAPTASN